MEEPEAEAVEELESGGREENPGAGVEEGLAGVSRHLVWTSSEDGA